MSRIHELFIDLRADSIYLEAGSGNEFERRISAKLEGLGYTVLSKHDIFANEPEGEEKFDLLKKEILKKDSEAQVTNPFQKYKKSVIPQPYSRQNYPDFLVLDNDRVISIEVKFSDKKQTRPVWNSGLPRPNGIYIFGSRGTKELTFFKGVDVLSVEDARKLHKFFDDELRKRQTEFNEAEMKDQPYGFAAYVRKAFEQKRTFNPKAVLDYFTNPDRKKLEDSVISHLQS